MTVLLVHRVEALAIWKRFWILTAALYIPARKFILVTLCGVDNDVSSNKKSRTRAEWQISKTRLYFLAERLTLVH